MGRHATDFLSLTFAVLFLSVGVLFLTGEVDPAEFVRLWALPIVLVAAGLVLGALGVTRHRRMKAQSETAKDPDEGTYPAPW